MRWWFHILLSKARTLMMESQIYNTMTCYPMKAGVPNLLALLRQTFLLDPHRTITIMGFTQAQVHLGKARRERLSNKFKIALILHICGER